MACLHGEHKGVKYRIKAIERVDPETLECLLKMIEIASRHFVKPKDNGERKIS